MLKDTYSYTEIIVKQDSIHWKNTVWCKVKNSSKKWDIDRMKPLSATVVLSYFINSELSPFYCIIRDP